jgi:hypothetical protein
MKGGFEKSCESITKELTTDYLKTVVLSDTCTVTVSFGDDTCAARQCSENLPYLSRDSSRTTNTDSE